MKKKAQWTISQDISASTYKSWRKKGKLFYKKLQYHNVNIAIKRKNIKTCILFVLIEELVQDLLKFAKERFWISHFSVEVVSQVLDK